MHVVLNVAEKPSVARAIADSLAGGSATKRAGKSQFNPIHEFQYKLNGRNCRMVVTSVSGHLLETDFPEPFNRQWHRCAPEELFDMEIEWKVPDGNNAPKIVKTLESESKRAHQLILWLDCDREGENIAFEVSGVCTTSNPRLDVWRAQFSDTSKKYAISNEELNFGGRCDLLHWFSCLARSCVPSTRCVDRIRTTTTR